MRRTLLLSGTVLGLAWASGALAQPAVDPRDARIQQLEQLVQSLAAKVDSLEARVGGTPSAVAPAAAGATPILTITQPSPAPTLPNNGGVSILAGKPNITSGDGRFSATFHGVMQFDAANYEQDPAKATTVDFRRGAAATDTAHARDLNSGTNFRRARIGIDGKLYNDWDFNVLYEFGGAGVEDAGHVQEMSIQYSGKKPFHARIGAFPPSIGLEDQASTNGAPFLERPAVADMARGLTGGDFREAAEVWANGAQWYVNAGVSGRVVGVVNSQATGVTQPFDTALNYIGRASFLPVKGDDWLVLAGVHGSYVDKPVDTGGPDTAAGATRYGITIQERPELRVDGTRLVSTGAINARHASTRGVEAAVQYRNFFLQGEYEQFGIERFNPAAGVKDPSFRGAYVEGTWVLTGERRRFNPSTWAFDAPTVDHPASLEFGTWGAIELAARWSTIDLNFMEGLPGTAPVSSAVRGGEQTITTLGVNWYMNAAVRFMFDFQHVDIDRLSPSASGFSTPTGAQIGQKYDVLMLRSQMAF